MKKNLLISTNRLWDIHDLVVIGIYVSIAYFIFCNIITVYPFYICTIFS